MKCLNCKKNEAEMHPIFGPLDCKECRLRLSGGSSLGGKKVHFDSDGQWYSSGGKKRFISDAQLEHIKSGVQTHEGQYLSGKEGKKYMDRYSKEYLKKDLSGSYKDRSIQGQC